MKQLFFLLLATGIGYFGFSMGSGSSAKKGESLEETKTAITDRRSFVFIVYAHNQAPWCERSLGSLFEQEYDYYRVIFIDDASSDATFEKAQAFILENNQDSKVLLIRNEEKMGPLACLHRAMDNLLEREIAIPLDAKDWLSHSGILTKLNQVYQDPNVWASFANSLSYPSYEKQTERFHSFYAALYQEIPLEALSEKGSLVQSNDAFLKPLKKLSKNHFKKMEDPFLFVNQTRAFKAP